MGAGLLASLVAVALLAGSAPVPAKATSIDWKTKTNVNEAASQKESASLNYAHTLSHAFRSASEKVLPSVVTIQSMPAETKAVSGNAPHGND